MTSLTVTRIAVSLMPGPHAYVSVNSKPDHPPPGAIFLMGEFPTPPDKKKVQNPYLAGL